MKLQWLQDSTGSYSYARVLGSVCILVNIVCLFRNYEVISNVYQVLVGCSGFITGLILWAIEAIRDMKNITVKLGDKEYSIKTKKQS